MYVCTFVDVIINTGYKSYKNSGGKAMVRVYVCVSVSWRLRQCCSLVGCWMWCLVLCSCMSVCVCVCEYAISAQRLLAWEVEYAHINFTHKHTHTHHNTVVSCLSVVEEVRKGLSEKETRCLIITIQPFPPHCVHADKQQYLWWMYHFFMCLLCLMRYYNSYLSKKIFVWARLARVMGFTFELENPSKLE